MAKDVAAVPCTSAVLPKQLQLSPPLLSTDRAFDSIHTDTREDGQQRALTGAVAGMLAPLLTVLPKPLQHSPPLLPTDRAVDSIRTDTHDGRQQRPLTKDVAGVL